MRIDYVRGEPHPGPPGVWSTLASARGMYRTYQVRATAERVARDLRRRFGVETEVRVPSVVEVGRADASAAVDLQTDLNRRYGVGSARVSERGPWFVRYRRPPDPVGPLRSHDQRPEDQARAD